MKNTYSEMKDSGVAWIGEIPKYWDVERAKFHFKQSLERGNNTPELLAATQKHGMYPQRLLEGVVQVMAGTNLQQFKTVHINDFVISLRSFQGGFERSSFEGVCSPAYQVFHADEHYNADWLKFFFKNEMFIDAMNALTVGIREGRNIKYDDFANALLPIPPISEQTAIAAYLDEKCGTIDEIIAEAKASIEEYKMWKSSVIFEAVTKGLDPNAEMEDSGVDIIGLMPKHWNLCRQRFLCKTTTGDHDTQDAEPEGAFPFYVRSPIIERSNTYTFDGEGVLMAGDGAGAGRVFHYATGKYAIHQRVYCFYDFKGILPRFYHYFMENLFCAEMDKGSAKSTVPSVRLSMLKDFNICLPLLTEQANIITALDEKCAVIDGIIAEKEALIADLEAYKKSLIFETVTGKRKVC